MAMRVTLSALAGLFRPPVPVKTAFRFSYLLTLALILLVLVFYFRLQPHLPLFYSLAQPSQQLAPREWLALFPVLSVFITFGHLIIVKRAKNYNLLLIQLFSWTTVVIQLLLTLALLRIIVIVS